MTMKEQAGLTALRDELRKTFEPFGASVEQFDIQLTGRSLRWRARTPDYPAHHVGGAFEEWTAVGARPRPHRVTIVVVIDEELLQPGNAEQHRELFASRWMPERFFTPNKWKILESFGIELVDPVITVLPAKGVWTSRP